MSINILVKEMDRGEKENKEEYKCMRFESDIINPIRFHFLYADKYSFGASWAYSEKNTLAEGVIVW